MLSKVDFKLIYSSSGTEPAEFFIDALRNSNNFDFCLGFFSTTGFRALSIGFAFFIKNGGKMRFIINNVLSPKDKEAIEKGQKSNPDKIFEDNIINDIEKIYKVLNRYDKHFFNCISWLIAKKRIEIKIVTPINSSTGIAHQKFGLFKDGSNNIICFNGSTNFSSNAFLRNLETINCYRSWIDEKSQNEAIKYFKDYFNSIWNNKDQKTRIIPVEKVKLYLRNKFPIQKIEDLFEEENQLLDKSNISEHFSSSLFKKIKELQNEILGVDRNEPHLPNNVILRDYQKKTCNK